jgi:hypothetical protein
MPLLTELCFFVDDGLQRCRPYGAKNCGAKNAGQKLGGKIEPRAQNYKLNMRDGTDS